MDDSFFIKTLVVGDNGVGKTSILNQYCYNKFDPSVNPTIGCDFCVKVLNDFEGQMIRLQLWDIAGQDRYTTVSRLYVKGALGCIVVADVTNPESLQGAIRWKEIIEDCADQVGGKTIPIILLHNKLDLINEEEPLEEYQTIEYLKKFARKHNFKACFQVSAKLDKDLTQSIEALVTEVLKLNLREASRDNFFRSERQSVSYRLSKFSLMGSGTETNTKDSEIVEYKNNKCNC